MSDGSQFKVHADGAPAPAVQVNGAETPAGQAVPDTTAMRVLMRGEAGKPIDVVDDRGRHITLKRLGWLETLQFNKALGPDLARNEEYKGIAVLAYMVTHIDGNPLAPALNADWIEARIRQLGDDGLDAIAAHLADLAQRAADEAKEKALAGVTLPSSEQSYRADVKNS